MKEQDYEALDVTGRPYIRKALVIGEMPHEKIKDTLIVATNNIAKLLDLTPIKTIPFGCPTYEAFQMRPADAKRHEHSKLLMTKGDDISLTYC